MEQANPPESEPLSKDEWEIQFIEHLLPMVFHDKPDMQIKGKLCRDMIPTCYRAMSGHLRNYDGVDLADAAAFAIAVLATHAAILTAKPGHEKSARKQILDAAMTHTEWVDKASRTRMVKV